MSSPVSFSTSVQVVFSTTTQSQNPCWEPNKDVGWQCFNRWCIILLGGDCFGTCWFSCHHLQTTAGTGKVCNTNLWPQLYLGCLSIQYMLFLQQLPAWQGQWQIHQIMWQKQMRGEKKREEKRSSFKAVTVRYDQLLRIVWRLSEVKDFSVDFLMVPLTWFVNGNQPSHQYGILVFYVSANHGYIQMYIVHCINMSNKVVISRSHQMYSGLIRCQEVEVPVFVTAGRAWSAKNNLFLTLKVFFCA